jgi:hypothetical protein
LLHEKCDSLYHKALTALQLFEYKRVCIQIFAGQLWPWSYGSWIYNYLCNQCLSPLMLWDRTPLMVRCTRYIKFVSDLRQVGGFLRVLRFSSPIKLTTTI